MTDVKMTQMTIGKQKQKTVWDVGDDRGEEIVKLNFFFDATCSAILTLIFYLPSILMF